MLRSLVLSCLSVSLALAVSASPIASESESTASIAFKRTLNPRAGGFTRLADRDRARLEQIREDIRSSKSGGGSEEEKKKKKRAAYSFAVTNVAVRVPLLHLALVLTSLFDLGSVQRKRWRRHAAYILHAPHRHRRVSSISFDGGAC